MTFAKIKNLYKIMHGRKEFATLNIKFKRLARSTACKYQQIELFQVHYQNKACVSLVVHVYERSWIAEFAVVVIACVVIHFKGVVWLR